MPIGAAGVKNDVFFDDFVSKMNFFENKNQFYRLNENFIACGADRRRKRKNFEISTMPKAFSRQFFLTKLFRVVQLHNLHQRSDATGLDATRPVLNKYMS